MKTMKRARKAIPIDVVLPKKECSVNVTLTPQQLPSSDRKNIDIDHQTLQESSAKVDFHLYAHKKLDEDGDLNNPSSPVQVVEENGDQEMLVSDPNVLVEVTTCEHDKLEDRKQLIGEYGVNSSSPSITSQHSSCSGEEADRTVNDGMTEVPPNKIQEQHQSASVNQFDLSAQSNASKYHTCEICWKRFSIAYNLKLHMRTHLKKKPLKCPHCNHIFNELSSLIEHIRIHKVERPFYCTECGCSFLREVHLIEHMHIHTCVKLDSCSYCHGKFASDGLEKHVRTQTCEKPFQCEKCGKKFSWKIDFDSHIFTHCKPYGCEVCGIRFDRQADWSKHIRICSRTTQYSNQ